MSRRIILLVAVLLGTVHISPAVAEPPAKKPSATPNAAVEEWRDMRFGMFIHWGPCSLTGRELSWSRGRETPVDQYDALYKRFNPTAFNADEWVRIAKRAGMKYLVITTKHHDGFCLWPSRYTDHHIGNTPFKRDVIKELAEACKKHDIKFGVYYSVADWYHPDDPDSGPGVEKTEGNLPRYFEYMRNQLAELLTNYGPICTVWFDGPRSGREYAKVTERMIRELQPNVLLNNRLGVFYQSDYLTPEQKIGGFDRDHLWETCMTMGGNWGWNPDDHYKSSKECLRTLLRIVGGDGNFLFNVGPRPDGRIDPEQVERLEAMGKWLEGVEDTVYGTRGGPFKPGLWGASTCKDNKIYLFIMDWPGDAPLVLPPIERKILTATTRNGGKIAFAQTDEKVAISVVSEDHDPVAIVVELTLDGPALDVSPKDVVSLRGKSLAVGKPIKASNVYGNMVDSVGPDKLVDGDHGTRWAAHESDEPVWVEIDLGKPTRIGCLCIDERQWNRVEQFALRVQTKDGWRDVYEGTTIGENFSARFKPVTAQRVRLEILKSSGGPTIWEIELYP